MTTSIKPAWETALRRRIKLPRHYTANDSASVLLRLSALAFFAAAIAFVVAPWFVARLALFSASAFTGLAVQQYAWYTGRIYTECWSDEGIPVVATCGLAALFLGLFSVLFWLLLPALTALVLIGGLHSALLYCWRWGNIWGSLFDGTEKLRDRQNEADAQLLGHSPYKY